MGNPVAATRVRGETMGASHTYYMGNPVRLLISCEVHTDHHQTATPFVLSKIGLLSAQLDYLVNIESLARSAMT